MNLIDEILLGRRRQNAAIRQFFSPSAVSGSSRIENFGPAGAVTSRRKADPNTIAAMTALQRTTGVIPENAGRRAQFTPFSNPETYQRLIEQGVRSGDNAATVFERLGGNVVAGQIMRGNDPLADLFAALSGVPIPQATGEGGGATRRQAKGARRPSSPEEALVAPEQPLTFGEDVPDVDLGPLGVLLRYSE